MANNLSKFMVALVLGGVFVAGTLTSCDDDDGSAATTGFAGTTGFGGTTGSGGTGGTANTTSYSMTLSAAQEVPTNVSAGTGTAMVTLNRTTGAVTVTGSFTGLTSNATAAHIHGPAAVGANGGVLIPLTVPSATSGSVTGNGTMSSVQMNDMISGMTYINIHTADYPDGEIRAQIVP